MLGGFIFIQFEYVLFYVFKVDLWETKCYFSKLLCIASILGWSLYLKIALGVRPAMFSVTGSNSLHLKIFRFFIIFEKKLFRVSVVSDSVFKISPFHLYWFYLWWVICLKIKVSLISRKACCQLRLLYLRFHKRYTVIHLPTVKNFIFFCSISRKIVAKAFFFLQKVALSWKAFDYP